MPEPWRPDDRWCARVLATSRRLRVTVPWTQYQQATPGADLQHAAMALLNEEAVSCWMNRKTLAACVGNGNVADLFGRRRLRSTLETVEDLSRLLQEQGWTMTPNVYDAGYVDADNVFHPFIPDGVVLLLSAQCASVVVLQVFAND